MMWLFLISDALTFAGLLTAYGMMRAISATWPEQADVFDMRLITFMTFALISSSATMAMAVGSAKGERRNLAVIFLALTIAGGLVFLGSQAYEWTHIIEQGATPFANPWNVPQFTASFFVITGFHGVHVLIGVLILLIVGVLALNGNYSADRIETAGLYWHFVDVVWVFIFAFFYLL
ncbi:MAG: cytochrome c oxidase subunit 3 [Acidobacteria bacterium]|nr:cytochrome c oxidase subunit 3 [Acidobacteriota bacterium]